MGFCLPACKLKPAHPLVSSNADTTPNKQVIDTGMVIPDPTGYINDYASLFTESQHKSLDSLVRNFESKTSIEIAVAVIDSVLVDHHNFDDYTLQMAKSWRVGKKEKNNGVLVAFAPDLRKIHIQNGYGIEKMISDEETKTIVDSVFIPYFKKGNYYEGTRQGIIAIMNKLSAKTK